MQVIAASDFRAAAAPVALGPDDIHLWWLPAWGGPPRGAAESDAVRGLLGAYLGRRLAGTDFVRGDHGKPRLRDDALEFNLAHSGGDLLLALCRGTAVGVDLELPRRARPVHELAARFFDASEAEALAALPDTAAQPAFLRLWACKEAVLKVDGGGISTGLDRVVFGLDAAGLPLGPVALRAPLAAGDWQLRRLAWPDGACGALAWRGAPRAVHAYRMTST